MTVLLTNRSRKPFSEGGGLENLMQQNLNIRVRHPPGLKCPCDIHESIHENLFIENTRIDIHVAMLHEPCMSIQVFLIRVILNEFSA